jgi:hypothetical protein
MRGCVICLIWNPVGRPPCQGLLPLLAHTSTPFSYRLTVSSESSRPLSLIIITLRGIPTMKRNLYQTLPFPNYKTVERSSRLVTGSRYGSGHSMWRMRRGLGSRLYVSPAAEFPLAWVQGLTNLDCMMIARVIARTRNATFSRLHDL